MSVVLLSKLWRERSESGDETGRRDSVGRAVHAVEEVLHRGRQPSLGTSGRSSALKRRLELGDGPEGLEGRVKITRVAEVDKTRRAAGRHGKFRVVHILHENNLLLGGFRQGSSVTDNLASEELLERLATG